MAEVKKDLNTDQEIGDGLKRLISEMDAAILQAIENPLLFLDGPFLNAIELRCARLAEIDNQAPAASAQARAPLQVERFATPVLVAKPSSGADPGLTALVWEVRARAGRLQRLLDSASSFYSTCFSPDAAGGLDYGVQGEWGQPASPSHLAINC